VEDGERKLNARIKNKEELTEGYVITIKRYLSGPPWVATFSTLSNLMTFQVNLEKALIQTEKFIAQYIPEPEPEPEPEPHSPLPHIHDAQWFSHCLLLATTGNGKTNALRARFADLLFEIEQGEASVVLMEPKGVFINELLRHPFVHKLRERVIVIDPLDIDYPVGINLFDKGQDIASSMAMAEYVLSTLTTDLTAFQRDTLTYAIRLLFAIDDRVTIQTLDDILRNGAKNYPDALPKLTRAARQFLRVRLD
jgi:hypothetical protein